MVATYRPKQLSKHSTQSRPETCSVTLYFKKEVTEYFFSTSQKSLKTAVTESVSRREFLDSVLGSGLLVYLSPVWLSEVYDLVNEIDVFEFGMRCGEGKGRNVNTLRNLLVDLDGLGKTHRGAQLLCDYR